MSKKGGCIVIATIIIRVGPLSAFGFISANQSLAVRPHSQPAPALLNSVGHDARFRPNSSKLAHPIDAISLRHREGNELAIFFFVLSCFLDRF